MQQQDLTTPDRRSVMQVCGLISLGLLGVPTLVACGSDDDAATGDASPTAAAVGPAPTTAAAGGAAGGTVLAKLADIPVGGALVTKGADGKPIALIQATAGTVTAVSAACTHKGVTVAPASGELDCPAHGSKFGFDGSVKKGPATSPLAAIAVKVEGENVVAA